VGHSGVSRESRGGDLEKQKSFPCRKRKHQTTIGPEEALRESQEGLSVVGAPCRQRVRSGEGLKNWGGGGRGGGPQKKDRGKPKKLGKTLVRLSKTGTSTKEEKRFYTGTWIKIEGNLPKKVPINTAEGWKKTRRGVKPDRGRPRLREQRVPSSTSKESPGRGEIF